MLYKMGTPAIYVWSAAVIGTAAILYGTQAAMDTAAILYGTCAFIGIGTKGYLLLYGIRTAVDSLWW